MERPTPRVNSSMLGEFAGKTVRIIGKVVTLDGESAVIESSDKGEVTIRLSRESNFADTYVEVIGKVLSSDNSIQEYTSVNMGDNIDMDLVEEVVKLTAKYKDLYPVE